MADVSPVRTQPVKPSEVFQRALHDVAPGCMMESDGKVKMFIASLFRHDIVIIDNDVGSGTVDTIQAILYGGRTFPNQPKDVEYPGKVDPWLGESTVTVYGNLETVDSVSRSTLAFRLNKLFGSGPETVDLTREGNTYSLGRGICAPGVRYGDTGYRPGTHLIYFTNGNNGPSYENQCPAAVPDIYERIDVRQDGWIEDAFNATRDQIMTRRKLEEHIAGKCNSDSK